MFLKNFCVVSLLLPFSSFVAADAYKCDPEKGYVSYQEHSCPMSDDQSIVRIRGNSHHIEYNAKEDPHPWWDKLLAIDKERETAARLQAEKRAAKEQEKIETAALHRDLEQLARCEKITALYHERVRLQGVEVTDAATGELRIDILSDAQEMIDSTRTTMETHCASSLAVAVDAIKPSNARRVVNGPR